MFLNEIERETIIKIEDLSFSYEQSADSSIQKINLAIFKGECVAFIGRSGCGKSTLTRAINGLIPHFFEGKYSGKVTFKDKIIGDSELCAISKEIGSVFQDPRSQFFTVNTTDEIAFGCENLGLSSDKINSSIKSTVKKFGLEELIDRSLFQLSSGEKQKIALASIYAMDPDVLVLDEPSANLDDKSIDELELILRRIKSEGRTIVISEHRLYYLKEIVDRFIYIDNGMILHIWTLEDIKKMNEESVVRLGLRSIDKKPIPRKKKDKDVELSNCYEIKGITVFHGKRRTIKDLSDSFSYGNKGKIIGIIGENGVGKTTLAKSLSGLLKIKNGEILLDGIRMNRKKLLLNSFFLMQDSDYQLFSDSVKNELAFGRETKFTFDEMEILNELEITNLFDRHPMTLSGGQKQRVCIANAILSNARIIFFDEPTSGLDGYNMRKLQGIFKHLKEKGKLIFVITHDYEFINELYDDLIVMHQE